MAPTPSLSVSLSLPSRIKILTYLLRLLRRFRLAGLRMRESMLTVCLEGSYGPFAVVILTTFFYLLTIASVLLFDKHKLAESLFIQRKRLCGCSCLLLPAPACCCLLLPAAA